MSEERATDRPDNNMQSVPDRTIGKFLDLLAENEEYQEITERLRSELSPKNKISESAIKKAVFGDEES
ncbi:hypothetical protein LJC15_00735 [Desulfovibrio sp. OttesenSCG-928-G11]|nr:hypothetical protein [Desulfovibrio sp. OttesenSCG-928-G11]